MQIVLSFWTILVAISIIMVLTTKDDGDGNCTCNGDNSLLPHMLGRLPQILGTTSVEAAIFYDGNVQVMLLVMQISFAILKAIRHCSLVVIYVVYGLLRILYRKLKAMTIIFLRTTFGFSLQKPRRMM
eukprot:gnl/TRDRNA2_/TRDRNA2_32236_c0_seq1.p2 gnl/TRDRNA2_/TRDRNA2_32236_c0~~gnl/TRDRNA2_/TRDRNA2_32236_c0_seq1.p2  ORF type:complete len:128 (+),score=12.87 gnl/TRDRNA2_/TRDRNA2_32236_c0_seq1:249-632(+)